MKHINLKAGLALNCRNELLLNEFLVVVVIIICLQPIEFYIKKYKDVNIEEYEFMITLY